MRLVLCLSLALAYCGASEMRGVERSVEVLRHLEAAARGLKVAHAKYMSIKDDAAVTAVRGEIIKILEEMQKNGRVQDENERVRNMHWNGKRLREAMELYTYACNYPEGARLEYENSCLRYKDSKTRAEGIVLPKDVKDLCVEADGLLTPVRAMVLPQDAQKAEPSTEDAAKAERKRKAEEERKKLLEESKK